MSSSCDNVMVLQFGSFPKQQAAREPSMGIARGARGASFRNKFRNI